MLLSDKLVVCSWFGFLTSRVSPGLSPVPWEPFQLPIPEHHSAPGQPAPCPWAEGRVTNLVAILESCYSKLLDIFAQFVGLFFYVEHFCAVQGALCTLAPGRGSQCPAACQVSLDQTDQFHPRAGAAHFGGQPSPPELTSVVLCTLQVPVPGGWQRSSEEGVTRGQTPSCFYLNQFPLLLNKILF